MVISLTERYGKALNESHLPHGFVPVLAEADRATGANRAIQ